MSTKPVILVVEDKTSEREALMRLLRTEQCDVLGAKNPKEALAYLEEPVDLVISDLRMGETSGVERRPGTPFVLVTAYGDVASAVEAMKLGAEDYINKPVNPDELLMLIGKCLESRRKDERIRELESRLDRRLGFEKIIGKSKPMLAVFDQARRAAMADSTVLITGESGSGKELFAEAIHQNSLWKDGPFVTVNMAAVPENLVESELFGHVKGSFTGATGHRIGRFEAAHGGTLFIDEVGDFAASSQAKLLRVLENHTITPVGSNEDREVNVRVVAATSRNLEEMVVLEQFREDLYYRLNVVNLRLPPLRDRRDDIPLLVDHFLHQLCESCGRALPEIDPALMSFFERYDWPGNVRQLANCLESMVVLARDNKLTLADLPSTVDISPHDRSDLDIPPGTSLEELEHAAVVKALEQHEGNRTRAAESLGISVRTLQRKLKAWAMDGVEAAGVLAAPAASRSPVPCAVGDDGR
jgi:DNA-binding NtrC family response regulator